MADNTNDAALSLENLFGGDEATKLLGALGLSPEQAFKIAFQRSVGLERMGQIEKLIGEGSSVPTFETGAPPGIQSFGPRPGRISFTGGSVFEPDFRGQNVGNALSATQAILDAFKKLKKPQGGTP